MQRNWTKILSACKQSLQRGQLTLAFQLHRKRTKMRLCCTFVLFLTVSLLMHARMVGAQPFGMQIYNMTCVKKACKPTTKATLKKIGIFHSKEKRSRPIFLCILVRRIFFLFWGILTVRKRKAKSRCESFTKTTVPTCKQWKRSCARRRISIFSRARSPWEMRSCPSFSSMASQRMHSSES